MALVGVAREACDHPASTRLPIGRVQTGKRRNEINAAVVIYRARQSLDVSAFLDQAEVVPHPLHERTRYRDTSFQCILRGLVAQLKCNRGDQAVLGGYRL